MNHSFDVEHAKKYGIGEAILIHHFVFWIAKNKANGSHFHDGRTWTYSTAIALSDLFPYFSKDQVDRIIKSLKDNGVILTGNYNRSAMDKTRWFAFADESLFLADYKFDEAELKKRRNWRKELDNSDIANSLNASSENSISNSEFAISNSEFATPIPDNKTNNKTNKQKQGALIFPEKTTETFKNSWTDWITYKKESKRFTYKSIKSEQIALNTLLNLAQHNQQTAIAIINQSIMNGWDGLFEIKKPIVPEKVIPQQKWKTGTDWN